MEMAEWGTTRQLVASLDELMALFGADDSEHVIHERLAASTALMTDLIERYLNTVVESDGRVFTNDLEHA